MKDKNTFVNSIRPLIQWLKDHNISERDIELVVKDKNTIIKLDDAICKELELELLNQPYYMGRDVVVMGLRIMVKPTWR